MYAIKELVPLDLQESLDNNQQSNDMWRNYPLDADDIDQFTQSDFDYQEANRAF